MGKRGRPRKNKTVDQIIEKITQAEPAKTSPFKEKIEKLKFIRIYDLKLIPKYLFEQVKPQNFDLNEIYAMAPNFETDPLTLIYVLADEEHKIKGFLWGYINSILKTIDFHILSVDKEYQDRGQIILRAKDFMTPLKEKIGYRAFRVITKRSKALSRLGFKKTGEVFMEV